MKLKKIASLMLAGIMAVSMLAACGDTTSNDDPASSEPTTSTNFTDAVLAKTSEATRDKLSAWSDTKLDEALEKVAENMKYGAYRADFYAVQANDTEAKIAKSVMGEDKTDKLTYGVDRFGANNWNFANVKGDQTYWTMYAISRDRSDDFIADWVADGLDAKSASMTKADTNYYVRVAKVTLDNEVGKDIADTVLVGIAVYVDSTTNNH